MRIGPSLVIVGALLGSLIVAGFGLFVTAHAAPVLAASADSLPAEVIVLTKTAQAVEIAQAVETQQAVEAVEENPSCEVSSRFPESILQWCGLITEYAHLRELPPNLVAAVMLQESGGQPSAYSHSGAVGLLQVMPRDGIAASFVCKNGPCFSNRPTISELEDPEFNIEYGTGMLANLTARLGNFRDALKAYGPMDAGYSYADKVLSIFENYGE